MAIIDTLKVYETLKVEMPDRSAKAVAKALEQSFEEYRVNQAEFLVTKQEMTEFRSEVRGDLAAMKQEMVVFRAEVREDLASMRQEMAVHHAATQKDIADLRTETANSKSETIKWMFIFWVGQVSVMTGLLIALR